MIYLFVTIYNFDSNFLQFIFYIYSTPAFAPLEWIYYIVCREILWFNWMGCYFSTSKKSKIPGYEDPTVLASETPCEYPSSLSGKFLWFCSTWSLDLLIKWITKASNLCNTSFFLSLFIVTVSEVEALYELYMKLSNSIIEDGLIHKVSSSLFKMFFSLDKMSSF